MKERKGHAWVGIIHKENTQYLAQTDSLNARSMLHYKTQPEPFITKIAINQTETRKQILEPILPQLN